MTVVYCLLIGFTLESGIQSGLFQSNTGYEELLRASSLAVQIADQDYNVRYSSANARSLERSTLDELHETLRHPQNVTAVGNMGNTWLFPDGRCWLYAETTVPGCDGAQYTEAIFSDVTELYGRRQELLAQTEQLRAMRREIKNLSDNVLEMTQEKEILSFKVRLHDQMGYGLAAVRQCLLQQQPPAETDLALRQLEKAVQLFDRDNAAPAAFGKNCRAAGAVPFSFCCLLVQFLRLAVLAQPCPVQAHRAEHNRGDGHRDPDDAQDQPGETECGTTHFVFHCCCLLGALRPRAAPFLLLMRAPCFFSKRPQLVFSIPQAGRLFHHSGRFCPLTFS